MLQKMRESAQGVLARVLIGVIIVVISAFGFGAFNVFSGRDRPVAIVNGEDIPQARFQAEVEQRHRALQGKPTDDLALQRDTLNMLIKRSLLLGEGRAMKLAVSQAAITARITQMSAFEVDGKFSAERMRQMLAQNGMSISSFRDTLADDELIDQLQRAITISEIPVPADLDRVAALLNQKRDIAWVEVDSASFAPQVTVNEADLQKFFAANAGKFRQPEQVAIDYIRVPRAGIAAGVVVSDAEVQAAYDAAQAVSAKSDTEQRHAAHILLQVNAQRTQAQAVSQLQSIAQRIAAGASFADVARETSEDVGSKAQGGDLGFLIKGAIGEPAFDAALWKLQPGQLSPPVVTHAGVHLISLVEVKREIFPPFAAQAAQLRASLTLQRVNDAVAAKKAELANDAYELDPKALAKRYKVPVQRSEFFGRGGTSAGITANRELLRVAFTPDVLDGAFSSPVVEIEQDLVVFKVADHRTARPQRFAEAVDAVRAAMVADRAATMAAARAAAIQAAVARAGEIAGPAQTLGITWQQRVGVNRNGADLPAEVRTAAFAVPALALAGKPRATRTQVAGGKLAVVVVIKVSADPAAMSPAERDMLGGSLRNLSGQRLFNGYLSRLEAKAKIDRRTVTSEPTPAG